MQSDSLMFRACGRLADGQRYIGRFTHYQVANAVTQDPTAVMQYIITVLSYVPKKKKKKTQQLDRASNYRVFLKLPVVFPKAFESKKTMLESAE